MIFVRHAQRRLAGGRGLLRPLSDAWRQLDEDRPLLIADCAYEQWHRLLFARFLAENNLLLHPPYEVPVTLGECAELAADLGEPDAWSVEDLADDGARLRGRLERR